MSFIYRFVCYILSGLVVFWGSSASVAQSPPIATQPSSTTVATPSPAISTITPTVAEPPQSSAIQTPAAKMVAKATKEPLSNPRQASPKAQAPAKPKGTQPPSCSTAYELSCSTSSG